MVLGTVNTGDPHPAKHNEERTILNELDANAVRKTLYDAKGDILIGSADNVVAKLGPVGANGAVVIADSAQTLGVRWSTGNRFFSGVGGPNSVVTAPVGSRYIDTAATDGAVEWLKTSGTGSTGWTVANGDTGWRELNASLLNGWTATQLRVRRVDQMIQLMFTALVATNATSDNVFLLPTGFRPHQAQRFSVVDATVTRSFFIDGTGLVRILSFATTDGSLDGCSASFFCATGSTNTWPVGLPGTAV